MARGDSNTTPSDEYYGVPADTPDVDGVDAPDNYLNAQTLIDNTEFGPEAKRPSEHQSSARYSRVHGRVDRWQNRGVPGQPGCEEPVG